MEEVKRQIELNIKKKESSFKITFQNQIRQQVMQYLNNCKIRGYDVADVTANTNLKQTHFVFISTGDPNSEMYFSVW